MSGVCTGSTTRLASSMPAMQTLRFQMAPLPTGSEHAPGGSHHAEPSRIMLMCHADACT